ncbi:hypothetical protein GCM10009634_35900 [Saccharothrix xinjiangensis]
MLLPSPGAPAERRPRQDGLPVRPGTAADHGTRRRPDPWPLPSRRVVKRRAGAGPAGGDLGAGRPVVPHRGGPALRAPRVRVRTAAGQGRFFSRAAM